MNDLVSLPAQSLKASRAFHIQIVFGTAFTFLTSGVFLSGFAMYMGATDLLVSYISMITNICGVSILFFSGLIGRFRSLKKITISLMVLSKLATLLIAFTLQAQATVVLNNWLVTFVDEKQSGKYIANALYCGQFYRGLYDALPGAVLYRHHPHADADFPAAAISVRDLGQNQRQERPCLCSEAVDLVFCWRNTVYGVIQ